MQRAERPCPVPFERAVRRARKNETNVPDAKSNKPTP